MIGLVYRNELGYCTLGYTDGQGYIIDFKSFCIQASFIDVLSARKSIVDEQSIEFRHEEKKTKVDIMESLEVNLPIWKTGDQVIVGGDNFFSIGAEKDYYLVRDNFSFGAWGFFGVKKLDTANTKSMKLSPVFLDIFAGRGFDKFVAAEDSVFISKDDLEVLLFSSIDEYEEDLLDKFERETSVIKNESTWNIKNKDNVKEVLSTLKEMRNLGASCIMLKMKGKELHLTSAVGAELLRKIEVDSDGDFNGCIGEDVLDILKVLEKDIDSIYVDKIMFLFDGKISLIANILEDV